MMSSQCMLLMNVFLYLLLMLFYFRKVNILNSLIFIYRSPYTLYGGPESLMQQYVGPDIHQHVEASHLSICKGQTSIVRHSMSHEHYVKQKCHAL